MTSAIGKRVLDLLLSYDLTFHDASQRFVANRSWRTRPGDAIAGNRQYVGQLLAGADFTYSWFQGAALGGTSTRNSGTARFANPDGVHNWRQVILDDLSVQRQPLTVRYGESGDELADMIALHLEGRAIRPSEDGVEVHVDLADKGQALDSSIFLDRDRFQGLGAFAVRLTSGAPQGVVPDSAGLDPASAFYLHVAYRIPSWASTSGGIRLVSRAATGGGAVYLIELLAAGSIRIQSRTSADVTTTLNATDLLWIKDGRWHHVVAKWSGTTLSAFYDGVRSALTTAQTTIKAGGGDLHFGDVAAGLDAHGTVEIALVALGLDADVPTDDEIRGRRRGLTAEEGAACKLWLDFPEGEGTTTNDSAGSHNATVPDDWQPTFEGPIELAGKAKPLAFGYAGANAEVVWSHRERGQGVLHARAYKGVGAALEGAYQYESVGWRKLKAYGVRFVAATDTIEFDAIADPTGVERFHAQPGFSGPRSGQRVVVEGTVSNNGNKTLAADASIRSMSVAEALTDEGPLDCYLTVLGPAGAVPRVTLWHEAGGVKIEGVPSLPATFEILGDIGSDVPLDDASSTYWPHYPAAIMRRVLTGWAGETSIAANWDVAPVDPIGAYWADAGFWLDPDAATEIREVMDAGNDTLWSRSGEDLDAGDWDLYVIDEPPATGGIALDHGSMLSCKRLRSIEPVGGFSLIGAINYRPLGEGEIVGDAAAATKEALRREFLEVPAVVDSTVAVRYPLAAAEKPIRTWLRREADLRAEAQRRYDILKVKREVYAVEAILYGLGENLLNLRVRLTDERFPTLEAGKDFWCVQFVIRNEVVTLTVWG